MAKIIMTDNDGDTAGTFTANGDDPISSQAQDNGIDVPVACGVGVCGSCKGSCKSGSEFIDPEAFGEAQVPMEDGEILTCLSGVKSDAPADATIEIELENY